KSAGIIAILDGPERVSDLKELTDASIVDAAGDGEAGKPPKPATPGGAAKGFSGKPVSDQAALYVPWLVMIDPFSGEKVNVPPSGHIAGLYGFNDSKRGVFKAPANCELATVIGLSQRFSRAEQGVLNPAGINCIRYFPDGGIRVWGART